MKVFIFRHTTNVILEVEGVRTQASSIETLQQRQVRHAGDLCNLTTHLPIIQLIKHFHRRHCKVKPLFYAFLILYYVSYIFNNKKNNMIKDVTTYSRKEEQDQNIK